MIFYIVSDFIKGLLHSIRIDLLIQQLYHNPKLRKLILKIYLYNLIMHLFPLSLSLLFYWLFDISLIKILSIFVYPINIFSILFHLLHHMDLLNMVCIYGSKSSNSIGPFDLFGLSVVVSIYQLVIYFTIATVNLFFYDKFYLLMYCFNFIILTIYHSFYCFNNLWQYKKIKISHRIDIHEKLWPYYIGYGTIATIIYLNVNYYRNESFKLDYLFFLGIYNMYITILLSIPFLIKTEYPKQNMLYFNINLSIFSYIFRTIYSSMKRILIFIKKNSN